MDKKELDDRYLLMGGSEGPITETVWKEAQEHGVCYLSRAELAERAGCSKSSVALALKEMERRDMLETEQRSLGNGSGLPTRRKPLYTLDEIKTVEKVAYNCEHVMYRWPRAPVK